MALEDVGPSDSAGSSWPWAGSKAGRAENFNMQTVFVKCLDFNHGNHSPGFANPSTSWLVDLLLLGIGTSSLRFALGLAQAPGGNGPKHKTNHIEDTHPHDVVRIVGGLTPQLLKQEKPVVI